MIIGCINNTLSLSGKVCIANMNQFQYEMEWYEGQITNNKVLTLLSFVILLKGNVSQMQNSCNNSINGQLLVICHTHGRHGRISQLEVMLIIQLDVIQTAILQKLEINTDQSN